MEGGQSGTYLRLTRVSSGPRVSVAKTYRDETKINISAKSQWPSISSRIQECGENTEGRTEVQDEDHGGRPSPVMPELMESVH